jgi:adenylate cyclase
MKKRRYASLISVLAAAALILPLGALQPRAIEDLRNSIFDAYQRAAPRPRSADSPARIVAIDEASVAAFGQWPWPRDRLAQLVDRLVELGAAAIAFDFLFAEPDRLSVESLVPFVSDPTLRTRLSRALAGAQSHDAIFAQSIARAPVVLGAMLGDAGAGEAPQKAGFAFVGDPPTAFLERYPAIVTPLAALAAPAKGVGATNWAPDHDQIVRRVALLSAARGGVAPALALEALRVAQGASTIVVRSSNASGETAFGRATGVNAIKVGEFQIQTGPAADVRPRYGYRDAARDISAAAVLRGAVDRAEIEGRIVFVGATAASLGDIRATPLEPVIAGVDVHAQVIESLIDGALLSRPDWALGLEFVVAALSFIAVTALLFLTTPAISAAMGVIGVIGVFAASYRLFATQGLLIDPGFPALAVAISYLVGSFVLWRQEKTARRHVHLAFGKYLSPAVVDRLVDQPERLALGGETRELTVLFSDLRNFSRISEGLTARELTQFMNAYLTPITDAILECEGTIDKYMGDAVLAFWNAPLDVPNHARKAATAALRMRAEIAAFNIARAAQNSSDVAMGCGLALGDCNVGNMGSTRRFDYSVLGDTVNLASRLEGASKFFKTDIVAAGSVQQGAPDFAWLDLGEIVVVGRAAPARVFALAGGPDVAASAEFAAWRDAHAAMRAQYESRDFKAAAESAALLAASRPPAWRAAYLGMEKRFLDLADRPIEEIWSPVWTLDSK